MSAAHFLTFTRSVTYKGLLTQSILKACSRTASGVANDSKPLKKAKTPQGRFDTEESEIKPNDPLQKFPDDINPETKEKGGPKGPEPTRYGDWERKGRCIDF